MTPEHLHLALNHLPFLGSGFALIPLLVGILFKSRAALVSGLLIAALSGWSTGLVMDTGEKAYERYHNEPISSMIGAAGEEAMELHEERAHDWSKVMYASAIVATLGLAACAKFRKAERWAAGASAILCAASLGAGIYTAESGGKIRRPDFRSGEAVMNGRPGYAASSVSISGSSKSITMASMAECAFRKASTSSGSKCVPVPSLISSTDFSTA